MAPKVSVVVPVYNAEAYIGECIKSLRSQTLDSLQLIFVNDGSQDKSSSIIKAYQKKDHRILLIEQENQGVSAARNAGITAAEGEYIGFVDADDRVLPDFFEQLYREATADTCDVVISNFESEQDGRRTVSKFPFPANKKISRDRIEKVMIPYLIEHDDLNSIWNKLYRAQIIKKEHIQFPYKVALGEDGVFNLEYFGYARSMKYIQYCGYYYRVVSGSATRNLKEKDYFLQSQLVYQAAMPTHITKIIPADEIIKLKSSKLIGNVMSYIHLYMQPTGDMTFSERYTYIKKMIRTREVNEALPVFIRTRYHSLGRYEKLLIRFIQYRIVFGLYLATAYIRYRNRSFRRK